MKTKFDSFNLFALLMVILFVAASKPQTKGQQLSLPITVTDNAAVPNAKVVYFGYDSTATDGIDLAFSEGELPPFPPSGNFEARLILPENGFSGSLTSYYDFRYGSDTTYQTVEYRLRYQKHNSASTITIAWNFPRNVTGVLKDVATNGAAFTVAMSGAGTYTVTNPAAFNSAKMTITYAMITPQVSIPITVNDNAPVQNSKTVYFGLDSIATDDIDLTLGEEELPPFPPSGNFEARFFLPLNNYSGSLSSYRDYRLGSDTLNGTKEYRLRYQKHSTATTITISWNIPDKVTCQMKDVATNGVIINVQMSGSGSYTVTNPAAFNAVKLLVTYNLGRTDFFVKAAPEGYYDIPTQHLRMRDTFSVFLASASAPFNFIDSGKTVIDSVSLIGKVSFNNAASGNYYLVIRGRNIIESWSKAGGNAVVKGSTNYYSFDTLATQTFGSNAILTGGKWCLYSGDVTQDGFVDFSDLLAVDNDQYNFVAGYVVTDLTGDNFVDFSDLTICDNNQFNFVMVVRPQASLNSAARQSPK